MDELDELEALEDRSCVVWRKVVVGDISPVVMNQNAKCVEHLRM